MVDGLIESVQRLQRVAEVPVCKDGLRVERQRPLVMFGGLVVLLQVVQGAA